MLEPQRSSFPFPGPSDSFRSKATLAPNHVSDLDRVGVLSGLRDTIQAGNHHLDTLLECIAEAAVNLTGATGSALAMWKAGAMVCRARAGHTAPPLGASLSADSGISGACLRTGEIQVCNDTENDERVDAEVCRQLGLRAMAALPIVGWHGVNGILEVFATQPRSFNPEQVNWLKQLAALAEKARALQPHSASSVVQKAEEEIPWNPAAPSDGVWVVILALVDRRRRPLIFGGIGLLMASLLGFAIWLGTRDRDDRDAKPSVAQSTAESVAPHPLNEFSTLPSIHPPSPSKPSAGTSVTLASKLQRLPERRATAPGSPVASDGRIRIERSPVPTPQFEIVEAPQLTTNGGDSTSLGEILSTSAGIPSLAAPASVTPANGRIVHKVMPSYPREALALRLQGAVRLEVVVTEDGSLDDVKAVDGPPLLAKAALDAVKQWRYQPYELNGKAVRVPTSITITFKLPE